jgi:hypothetical protein
MPAKRLERLCRSRPDRAPFFLLGPDNHDVGDFLDEFLMVIVVDCKDISFVGISVLKPRRDVSEVAAFASFTAKGWRGRGRFYSAKRGNV